MSWTRRVLILAITVMLAACGAVDGADTPLHVSSLTSNQTTPAPETPLTPVPTASTTSSASTTTGTNTSTDRTTMIIVVACAVAAFAIVVIIVIVRSRHSHKDELDHEATTPNETAFSQFNTETTTVNNQGPPDAVPVALKSYPVHRPSQAYTERSTVESLARESAFAVEIPRQSAFDIEPHRDSTYDFETPRRSAYVMGDSRDLDSEDGDVAMLESYAEPRTYNDGSFLSVVDFGDSSRSFTMGDSSQSLRRDDSSRSLDVDSYRRNHTVDPNDTLFSNDSIMSYWHHDDEESLRGTTTFADAKEPPTEKYL